MSDTSSERIAWLLFKQLKGEADAAELAELDAWKQADPGNTVLLEHVMAEGYINTQLKKLEAARERSDRQLMAAGVPVQTGHARRVMMPRWLVRAAVVLLLIIGTGIYYEYRTQNRQTPVQPVVIIPGSNKAVLTLADGSITTLDSAGNLTLQQGNAAIHQQGGSLQYEANTTNPAHAGIAYNTLTTPRGGQFRLVLPDGSQVWLNAASSLRYPTAFIGAERRVEVTGEAYFEVKADPTRPFIVNINNHTEIDVLGTHFNVNAYPDEPAVNTTLLQGVVKVGSPDHMVTLAPGQQAQLNTTGEMKVLSGVDVTQAVAWKNGVFYFKHADVQTVMRQVSRWYDVEVVYEGNVPAGDFEGKIGRDLALKDVLEVLQKADVHFRITGRKLIVTP